jgi:hypothetical protein
VKSLIKGAVLVGIGGVATQMITTMIPLRFGGAWGNIAMKFGVAYGLGIAAGKFLPPADAEYIALGGAASAAVDAFDLIRGRFPAVLQAAAVPVEAPAPAPAQLPAKAGLSDPYYDGYGDLVAFPGVYDSFYGQTSGMGDGMSDIVLFPR